MTSRRVLRLSELPTLHAFARGYLHEHLIADHGSAGEAAAAFARAASAAERAQLVDELERLERIAAAWPVARLARFFNDRLGAAWTPASHAEIRAILERLR
jgi:hypothetical protein